MANKYLVTDTQLENIANAIRNKSKETAKMGIEDMPEKIANLTGEMLLKPNDYPDYVRKEVMRVANLARTKIKDDSLVSICMSDSHYPDAAQGVGAQHALMAIKSLAYLLPVNFIAHMGDIGFEGNTDTTTTVDVLQQHLEEILPIIKETRQETIPLFVAIGNHDAGIYITPDKATDLLPPTYMLNNFTKLAGSEEEGVVYGGLNDGGGGYCYRDFTKQKIRVFLLNTSESIVKNGADGVMLPTQQQWIAQQLINLNQEKGAEASNWGFIVLCHYPLDYGGTKPVSNIFKAYVAGESISVNGTTYSFVGKNQAKFIVQFHGHIHNFLIDQLYFGDIQTRINGTPQTEKNQYEAYRMAIPNAQYNRENYYYGDVVTDKEGNITEWSTDGLLWGIKLIQGERYYSSKTVDAQGNEPTLTDKRINFTKVPGTEEDVSFVVNVINPDEEMIYSFTYGAGPEMRTIGYNFNKIQHEISFTSKDNSISSSNPSTVIYDGSEYRTTLIPIEGYKLIRDTITIKMGNQDITDEVLNLETGEIIISKVIGNIEISAYTEAAAYYTVTYELINIAKGSTAVDKIVNEGTPSYAKTTFVPANEDLLVNPYLTKVTMGGNTIPVELVDNKYEIQIDNVNGPVVIHIEAYKSNLWKFAENGTDSNIYNNGWGFIDNYYLGGSEILSFDKEPTQTVNGYVTTGYIPYQAIPKIQPPTIIIKGIIWDENTSDKDNIQRCRLANADKVTRAWIAANESPTYNPGKQGFSIAEIFTITPLDSGGYSFVPKMNSGGYWTPVNGKTDILEYIRFTFKCETGKDLVINVDGAIDDPVKLYNISYSINNLNLTNTASTIKENERYYAKLEDTAKYKLNGTPIITMGEIDITSTVWNESTREIIIEKVTGDIVITAESEIVAGPSYNNLIDEAVSAPGTTDIYNGIGYKKGVRLSTSANGGEVTDNANMYTTGYIDCSSAGQIYIKNIGISSSPKAPYCFFYDSTGTAVSSGTFITLSNLTSDSNGVITIDKPNNSTIKYLRICSNQIDETSIITINEYIDD